MHLASIFLVSTVHGQHNKNDDPYDQWEMGYFLGIGWSFGLPDILSDTYMAEDLHFSSFLNLRGQTNISLGLTANRFLTDALRMEIGFGVDLLRMEADCYTYD